MCAFNLNTFAVRFNSRTGDVKAKSNACFVKPAASVALVKSIEDEGEIRFGNTLSLVVDRNEGLLVLVDQRDAVFASLKGEFHRVVADVIENLINGIAIGVNQHLIFFAVEFHIQLFLIDLLLKGDQNETSHFGNIEDRLIELAVACLNARDIKQR